MHYNNQLLHVVIRMAKKDSVFIYSILEASEGLFFYSTIKHSPAQRYRDVDIKGSIGLVSEIDRIVEYLKNRYLIEIISRTIIDDSIQESEDFHFKSSQHQS